MYRSIQRGHRGSEPGRSGGHDPPRSGLHAVRNRRARRHHSLLHHRKIVSLTKYENVPCIGLLDPPMPYGNEGNHVSLPFPPQYFDPLLSVKKT